MQEISLDADFGTMITADGHRELRDVPGGLVRDCVQRTGALVLRGFKGGLEEFEQFTQTVASRFIHNGNDSREIMGDEGKTRSVTPGQNFIGPHSEFSYTPFRPDLLFFYCLRPAESGGASLLWDGIKLWNDMPDDVRNLFLGKSINNHFRGIDIRFFGQFAGSESFDDICAFLDGIAGFSYSRVGDAIDFEYNAPAQVCNVADGSFAFSNSIAVMPQTVFDDGSSLNPIIRADLLDIALRNTLTIDTLAGDVLIIDNWRVMHGRTAFEDAGRKMCIRMGYLDQLAEPRFSASLEEIEY